MTFPVPLAREGEMHAQAAYTDDHAVELLGARQDPVTFCRYVLRDEETEAHIDLVEMHEQMHDAITEHTRVVIWAHFESGKTNQITIGRVLWELGRDPNLRVAIVSRAGRGAKKFLAAISKYIERSNELHEVFPDLIPSRDPRDPWTSEQITIQRSTFSKDPSVQVLGLHGQILGARIDLLILDDLLDFEVTATAEQREKVQKWTESTLFTRATKSARIVFLGNAWHEDDVMHKAVEEKGFFPVRLPVYTGGVENDNAISWPARWPPARIAQAKLDLGPIEFARKLLCIARNDDMSRFKIEWVNTALDAGDGWSFVEKVDKIPNGCAIYTGVDLSTGEGPDFSSFATVLRRPDGKRQLLNLETHRITGPDIVRRLDQLFVRYGGLFIVENNASQQFILQFAKELTDAHCRPYTTGKQKANPTFGIEGIAVELARGDWIVPSERKAGQVGKYEMTPEVEALVRDMLFYDPRKHTGDRLMALFFAREACVQIDRLQKSDKKSEGVGFRVIGAPPQVAAKGR